MTWTPLGQTRSYTCGPASLRWVLRGLGKRYSERELTRLCATTKNGTDHGALARAARLVGAKARGKTGAGLDDLIAGLTIVGWDTADRPGEDLMDDHYSVFLEARPDHVVLMDPEPVKGTRFWSGSIRRLPREEFLQRWYDRSGSQNRLYRNWALTLSS